MRQTRLAPVVPFPRREASPAARPARANVPRISQERLQKAAELLREEWRIVQMRREFALALQADLAAGAEVEPGDLVFDENLKVVRYRTRSVSANLAKMPARV